MSEPREGGGGVRVSSYSTCGWCFYPSGREDEAVEDRGLCTATTATLPATEGGQVIYTSVSTTHTTPAPRQIAYTLNPRGLDTPLQLGRNFKGKDLHKCLISCACKKIFNLEISAVDPDP